MPPQYLADPWFYGGTTGSAINADTTIWQTWTSTASTTVSPGWFDQGTQANANTWQTWNIAPTYAYVAPPLTALEKARRLLIATNRARAQMLRRKRAERVAEQLLLETLSDDQAAEYRRLERFHLIVGDRTYRIRKGMHGNIDVIEDDTIVERLCVYAQGGVPAADNMLAQKLLLETDEEHLRARANITRMRRAMAA